MITIFERGGDISFANCGMPYYIGGEIPDRKNLLVQTPESFRRRFNIDVRVQSEVTRIDRDKKWAVLEQALSDSVSRPVMGLLRVLIYKGRETTLDNIATHFERFRDLAENRVHAHVTVASSLGDENLAALKARLESASGKNVSLHERVDPSVMGGASLRVGDRVIDRTLKTKLAALRKSLLATANQR